MTTCVFTLKSEKGKLTPPPLFGEEEPNVPSLSLDHSTARKDAGTSTSETKPSKITKSFSAPAEPGSGTVISHNGAEFGGPTVIITDAVLSLPEVSSAVSSIACSPSVR